MRFYPSPGILSFRIDKSEMRFTMPIQNALLIFQDGIGKAARILENRQFPLTGRDHQESRTTRDSAPGRSRAITR